jgi:PAS domain S-box-containing protein
MRGKILQRLVRASPWGLAAALVLLTVPASMRAFSNEPTAGVGQTQTEQERCKFLMENVNSIILTLDSEGAITFLNQYGQKFFGYSEEEILGKPMLGTLTPPTGFEGRDLVTFMDGVLHHPNRYAFSVNVNMRRGGERVWIFWANKGISDDRGEVREVIRVGLDITDRKNRLGVAATELRGIGDMLEGRSWVQRKKLAEITSSIEAISEDLERPWMESDTGAYESVAPSHH